MREGDENGAREGPWALVEAGLIDDLASDYGKALAVLRVCVFITVMRECRRCR